MPTYDYVCDACGHQFEKFQSITARPIRHCPKCGKNQVRRLIGTGAGVIFKGSGFYQTDYRSESYHKAAEKDKPSGGKGENSNSGAGDTSTTAAESTGKSKSDGKAE